MTKTLFAAAFGCALVISIPATAKPGNAKAGPVASQSDSSDKANKGRERREEARGNRRALERAAARAILRSNDNAGLRDEPVSS